MVDTDNFDNEALLNRICEVYGFSQKIQLAKHFDIAASSLQNRYKRGNMSYDFAVFCALETGADLKWLMTGEGAPKVAASSAQGSTAVLPLHALSDGRLLQLGEMVVDAQLLARSMENMACVRSHDTTYFVENHAPLADGQWIVNIEGAISLRDVTVLPGKKLHVTGGKVPFECAVDEIVMLSRVVGAYNEMA